MILQGEHIIGSALLGGQRKTGEALPRPCRANLVFHHGFRSSLEITRSLESSGVAMGNVGLLMLAL